MAGDPETEDDDSFWFRPPWMEDDAAALDPPDALRPHRPLGESDYTHPLLTPLAVAQDAVARLEVRVEAASPAVAEGLRARMAYREASG